MVSETKATNGYNEPVNEGNVSQEDYAKQKEALQYAEREREQARAGYSDKNWIATLLLCIFLGELGVHRFYTGKVGTGLLWLFTLGFLGIGVLVDIIVIAIGRFKDKQGRKIVNA